MTALKLDGRAAAAEIKEELRERVAALKERGIVPGIATVLVGADPASQLYVGMKHRAVRGDRHELDPARAAGRCHAGRGRGAHRRAQRRPRLPRLHRAAAAAEAPRHRRDPGAHRPGQGCRRPAPDQPRAARAQRQQPDHLAAAVHAARSHRAAACATATTSAGKHVVVVGSRRHDRPLDRAAADPPRVQRDRDPDPHRHGRPRPPPASGRRHRRRGRASSTSCARRTSSPARPCSTSA